MSGGEAREEVKSTREEKEDEEDEERKGKRISSGSFSNTGKHIQVKENKNNRKSKWKI